jgi:HK97 family phage portal protein
VGIRSYLRGTDIIDSTTTAGERRTLAPGDQPERLLYPIATPTTTPATTPLSVGEQNVLRVADAWACVRALSDSVASLPARVYRRTPAGRIAAGDDQRLVQLLRQPAPGSTSADVFGTAMVHLQTNGNAFVAKYRAEGSIVSLGLLDPRQVQVELRGQRVVYTLTRQGRRSEHGPEDILHVKAMSADGLRGLSPVTHCRLALGLNESMRESSRQYFEEGSRPSGILTMPLGSSNTAMERLQEDWRNLHGGVHKMHRVALIEGDAKFEPISFSADDSQFLQQRELSTREIARIFRVPAWLIDGASGDSLTYSNTLEQNRAFTSHSLRPWLVRLERAFSNDPDLCPGGAYLQFDLDGLLRADAAGRADIYTKALDPVTGWMSRGEVRELEELPPEGIDG